MSELSGVHNIVSYAIAKVNFASIARKKKETKLKREKKPTRHVRVSKKKNASVQ